MKLEKSICMNLRMTAVLIGALVLAACGAGKATEALGRAPAKVTDDGIAYPRTFAASGELRESAGDRGLGSLQLSPTDSDSVLGCSESRDGAEFVFYVKSGDDQFKMTFENARFRDTLSTYPDLVKVELAGRILGLNFDRAKQDYQVEGCRAWDVLRSGDSIRGQLECMHVTGLASDSQATLTMQFSCEIIRH
jgi:hypothetical protein